MKHKKSEYDYIINIRGKQYRAYYGGVLWNAITIITALGLAAGFFAFYMLGIILAGG